MRSPIRGRASARLLVVAGLALGKGEAAATLTYVDASAPSCSNTGAGGAAQPYCSIAAAISAHGGPGDTVLVLPGIYREQVSIPLSGAPGAPFVLAAQGPGAVVDGADDLAQPGSWVEALPGPAWRAASVTWSPRQVFMDGARLQASPASPESLPPLTFRWIAGEGLYVNAGGNPGLHALRVGRRAHGFSMYGRSWVTVQGFEVTGTEDRGIILQGGCTQVTLSRNRVSFAGDFGFETVGGSAITFDQNVASDNLSHGIGLISGATACIVSGNECFRNTRPGQRAANGIYLFGAPSNTLFRNRLHHNQDSGMQIQSGSNDCLAYDNRSWSNGDHGYDHLFATGAVHICDVAWGNYRDGFSIEGNATGVRLKDCIATDNGVTAHEYDLWVDAASAPTFQSDYNIFWNSASQAPVKIGTTIYPTLAAYQAASGQDAHSVQADPRFTDPGAGDFQLSPGSPAIDSGDSDVPSWPATDAEGRARVDVAGVPNAGTGPVAFADRGALEFDGALVGVGDGGTPGGASGVFPDPLAGPGVLRFVLERPAIPRVTLTDLQGRVVRELAPTGAATRFALPFDPRGRDGRRLAAGVYFYRVQTAERTLTGRFVVLR